MGTKGLGAILEGSEVGDMILLEVPSRSCSKFLGIAFAVECHFLIAGVFSCCSLFSLRACGKEARKCMYLTTLIYEW